MPSLRARLIDLALPLLGIKRFFSEPERMDARIARMRRQKPVRPRGKWYKRFEITETASRGFPVVTIEQRGSAAAGTPHLLYLHGGGYVMDIAAVHWDAIAKLCDALGASATVPIYPLAPEAKAATTLVQMRDLYGELADCYGATNITVMGDSAGGGMTLALAQMLAEEGVDMPASLVLFSPWLDAAGTWEEQAEFEQSDRMLSVAGLEACGRRYAGELALDDYRVSPLFGPLEGLPPMAILAGTHDILVVDARRLARRLSEPGMPAHIYREYDAMMHVWMLLPIPEGRKALRETAEFIRDHHKGENS